MITTATEEQKEFGGVDDYQNQAAVFAFYPSIEELALKSFARKGMMSQTEADDFIRTMRVDEGSHDPFYTALGLAGEVGEVCNDLKKVIRDECGVVSEEFKKKSLSELGDVLWYVAMLAKDLGLSLSDIATYNVNKLESRAERGMLGGSGSDR